ncbi:MAG: hypothetical protein N3A53_00890 [Verrucomicrobiae bacterium]|nr:hypothetical protein [Verrucomicrobiae bacterium]
MKAREGRVGLADRFQAGHGLIAVGDQDGLAAFDLFDKLAELVFSCGYVGFVHVPELATKTGARKLSSFGGN